MNFYNFTHFIQIWLFPPGCILVLLALGLVSGRRIKWVGKSFIVLAFITCWLLSTPIIAQFLIDGLQRQYAPLSSEQSSAKYHDAAIVILGAGVEDALEYSYKNMPSAITLSRIHYAAYLYQKTYLPIIASGGNRNNTGRTEADVIRDELNVNYNIVVKILENKSRNTKEESRFLIPLLQQYNIHTIFLVTNAWHMPRSMYIVNLTLQNTGIQVIPAPMGYIFIKSGHKLSNYLPLLNALNTSVYALHEYLGIAWYKVSQVY